MHDSARSLARYGRHGDNNLLHVSNSELRGIELLTGKKFTRNPDTGLPEAFNFGKILGAAAPIIAGVGGTILSGGNPLVGAAAAGATSGAVAKAEGKSTEQALAQGLMTGITSYAGGQLLGNIGDVGAAQAASQAPVYGPPVPEVSSASAAMPVEAGALQQIVPPQAGGTPAIPSSMTPGMPSAPSYESALESIRAGKAANVGGAPQFGNIDQGLAKTTNLSDVGTALTERPGAALGEVATPRGLLAGAGLYTAASDLMSSQRPNIPGQTPYDPGRYPEAFPAVPRTWNAPPVGYIPGQGPEYRYFAKGGLATMRSSDNAIKNIVDEAKAAILGEHPRPKEALGRLEETFGPGSTALLRERIGGGRVSGAGGGMDDLVPGSIEGRQKVRLADGEFVVPADVVSGLGDGSTDQGVRRLHGMMDKVRKERTGKEEQPKSIGGKITL